MVSTLSTTDGPCRKAKVTRGRAYNDEWKCRRVCVSTSSSNEHNYVTNRTCRLSDNTVLYSTLLISKIQAFGLHRQNVIR